MEDETRTLQINGIAMNVLITGAGPDVLLVHGYPDSHHVWRRQIAALVAAGYRVIAPDTRGCGDTEISSRRGDYHITNLVTDLIELLDALHIDEVRLVGHDWGSAICWQLAIDHPERVNRYVALSTGHPMAYRRGGLDQKIKGYYTLMFQLPWLPELLLRSFNWFGFRLLTQYPQAQRQWQSQLARPGRLKAGLNYYRANTRIFLCGDAANTRVPVMGVWSSGDRFLAEGQMRDSARYTDASFRFERIEGANHWLQLSGADKFNPLLLDYLK
jgi:pimeloyl-ACP methyl ester carboxylesterase